MLWITKYRHNKIVEGYTDTIKDLREALWRRDTLTEIVDKLTDKTTALSHTLDLDGCLASSSIMDHLDDTVPRYVEDVLGGKVIKQEATLVTILDKNGKATYGYTKQPADKGKKYKLVIK